MNYNNKIIIGIDTSCYTTSIAAINLNRDIVFNEKVMLEVNKNSNGLRQSEAVFQHINNLDKINKVIENKLSEYEVVGICSSSKPRPIEESYMPVFRVGNNFSKMLSTISGCKHYETTHQENHIKASLHKSLIKNKKRFITVHMSGGTTEILLVENENISIIGKTLDVSFGQVIDRIGVRLGYVFPCGIYLDNNAISCNKTIKSGLKTSVKNGDMNLSGLENQCINLIEKGHDSKYISKALFSAIIKSLYKSITYLCNRYNIYEVVFAGGVSSSTYIKQNITNKLRSENITSYFTEPEYATDNALGCAIIGLENYLGD